MRSPVVVPCTNDEACTTVWGPDSYCQASHSCHPPPEVGTPTGGCYCGNDAATQGLECFANDGGGQCSDNSCEGCVECHYDIDCSEQTSRNSCVAGRCVEADCPAGAQPRCSFDMAGRPSSNRVHCSNGRCVPGLARVDEPCDTPPFGSPSGTISATGHCGFNSTFGPPKHQDCGKGSACYVGATFPWIAPVGDEHWQPPGALAYGDGNLCCWPTASAVPSDELNPRKVKCTNVGVPCLKCGGPYDETPWVAGECPAAP